MTINPLRRTLDFMAKMGLTVRDDPPRVIDIATRAWGDPSGGFALSIEQNPGEPTLSVVLRNVGESPRTLRIPSWLAFYTIEINAPLTPFGRELRKPERQTERINPSIPPGEVVETQIPVASLFDLTRGETYRVRVSCTLPDGASVLSNPTTFDA